MDHVVHVWMPDEGWRTESSCGGEPPSAELCDQEGSGSTSHRNGHVTKPSNPILNSISPLTHANCAQQSDNVAVGKLTSLANDVQGHPQWSHRTFNIIGFSLSLTHTSHDNQPLLLSLWPSNIRKGSFIKHG